MILYHKNKTCYNGYGDKMKLYIVRHSYTEINEQKRIQGRIDIPLSENGKKHAFYVFNNLDLDIDLIATSPLIRATQTAMIIKEIIGHKNPLITIQDFVERDFGSLDYEFVEAAIPYVSGEKTLDDYESDQDLIKRAKRGLHLLYQYYPNKTILLVSHAHVMKALLTLVPELDIHFSQTKIMHQEYFCIDFDGTKVSLIEHKML